MPKVDTATSYLESSLTISLRNVLNAYVYTYLRYSVQHFVPIIIYGYLNMFFEETLGPFFSEKA